MEVFLFNDFDKFCDDGLLHARGGVSGENQNVHKSKLSSPRSWRCFSLFFALLLCCFVFSTLVEVFLFTIIKAVT